MSGQSLSETIGRWADQAAAMASSGEVCEENLRAVLGSQFDPALAWEHAAAGYSVMLEQLRKADQPLVLKLILPLTPRVKLDLVPPEVERIEQETDTATPPSLVVHRPLFRRDWEPVEEYRRPYETGLFRDAGGRGLAEGLYIVFRSKWEIEDNSAYRRQLLFERVQT